MAQLELVEAAEPGAQLDWVEEAGLVAQLELVEEAEPGAQLDLFEEAGLVAQLDLVEEGLVCILSGKLLFEGAIFCSSQHVASWEADLLEALFCWPFFAW